MTIGTTTFNSKTEFTNNINIGNSNQLSIDIYGNINTISDLQISGNLTCNNNIVINRINSSNNSISVDSDGNCLLNGFINTKDTATFANNLYLKNKDNQIILNLSANTPNNSETNYSYLNLSSSTQRFGIGTTLPEYFIHIAGELYSENKIINNNCIINPASLQNQNTSKYALSVGGNINLTGGIFINGSEVLPGQLSQLSEILTNISKNGGGGNVNSSSGILNTFSNGSYTVNGVSYTTWTSINNILYYTEGNVGIGTKNPTYPFQVEGNTSIRGNVIYLYGDVYYNDSLLDDLMTGLWNNTPDNDFNIYTAFNVNSNVGIGIKDPLYKLDIVGNFHITDTITADNDLYVSNNVGIGTITPEYKLDVNGDLRVSGKFYINGKEYVETDTENVFWMQNSSTNGIYYLDNVGINTTNPQYNLHIIGDCYIDGDSTFTGISNISNLNILNNFTFYNNKFIIDSNGDSFVDGLFYSNNIHGDIPSYTKMYKDNSLYLTFSINSKIFQNKKSPSQYNQGIGNTNNGMIFSNDGTSFSAIVPFGSDTTSSNTSTFNGVIQNYKWDSITNSWYEIGSISNTLLGLNNINNFMSSIAYNTSGTFIAVSTFTNTSYKVLFFNLNEDNSWTFINYIDMDNNINAGIFMVMDIDIKYLFVSTDYNDISLYINEDQNTDTNISSNFVKNTFSLLPNNNIGNIDDMKMNNDCSIVIISSSTGNTSNIVNGTLTCYALWSTSGYPDINSSTPFYLVGNNITNYSSSEVMNISSNQNSHFGDVCTISNDSNIDFKDGNPYNFEYNITIAISTGGYIDPTYSPAYVKIYKFTYNTNNNTSGIVYPTNTSSNQNQYIDGTWNNIGYIDHVTYNSIKGFGKDIKLTENGTNLYVGSPNENYIYLFNYDSTDNTWSLINKIQGFKFNDFYIGNKLALNYNKGLLATSSYKYFNSKELHNLNNYVDISMDFNNITIFNIENN